MFVLIGIGNPSSAVDRENMINDLYPGEKSVIITHREIEKEIFVTGADYAYFV